MSLQNSQSQMVQLQARRASAPPCCLQLARCFLWGVHSKTPSYLWRNRTRRSFSVSSYAKKDFDEKEIAETGGKDERKTACDKQEGQFTTFKTHLGETLQECIDEEDLDFGTFLKMLQIEGCDYGRVHIGCMVQAGRMAQIRRERRWMVDDQVGVDEHDEVDEIDDDGSCYTKKELQVIDGDWVDDKGSNDTNL